MRAAPWKSGASAPRKAHKIGMAFSPAGRTLHTLGVFPQSISATEAPELTLPVAAWNPHGYWGAFRS
jgi:hypothetical protein